MQQTSMTFDPAQVSGERLDPTAFRIGWDHARHGLLPPAARPEGVDAVGHGWRAAQAVFGHRCLPARPATRQWLALRLAAWQAGEAFDPEQITPQHLAQIAATRCPVRRVALGGAVGTDDAPVVLRLNPEAAWAPGHLVMLSHSAAAAMVGVDAGEARRRARWAERIGGAFEGLDAAAWWRVAGLRAFATPLPFAVAATLPLAVQPPNRVRLLNDVQGLQALVTLAFASPGWAARCAVIASMLPEHTLRHDFNLFVGAMAPRVLEAPAAGPARHDALEDAWLDDRLQRRWQHFVLSLGEAGVKALLPRVAELPQRGRHVLHHAPERAVDAWQLPDRAAKPVAGRGPAQRPTLVRLAARRSRAVRPATLAAGVCAGTMAPPH